jgi:phosphatidylglycerol:prolipoprotein diacylglycerol transferase
MTIVDAAALAGATRWDQLGLSPIALDLGFFQLRWYSLGYLAGIMLGWWYLLKLLARPGAPMARRHATTWSSTRPGHHPRRPAGLRALLPAGLLPRQSDRDPAALGWRHVVPWRRNRVSLGILYMARKHGLDWLRVHDYVACCVPFGLGLVRVANFVNGELWGRPTNLPWGVVFPAGGEVARHPSQLYEAVLEGPVCS